MSPAQEGPGCMVDGPQGLRGLHPHFGLDKGIALPLSWLSTGTFRGDGTVPCLPHPLYLPHGAVENFAQHGTSKA